MTEEVIAKTFEKSSVLLGALVCLVIFCLAYVIARSRGKHKKIHILIILFVSIIIGISGGFIVNNSFNYVLSRGDYSTHKCSYCKQPSTYKFKNANVLNQYYCESHYSQALSDFERYANYVPNSGNSHRCAICGKTEKTRQITAQTANGKWDEYWYCPEHYADAWQYYYGTGKK